MMKVEAYEWEAKKLENMAEEFNCTTGDIIEYMVDATDEADIQKWLEDQSVGFRVEISEKPYRMIASAAKELSLTTSQAVSYLIEMFKPEFLAETLNEKVKLEKFKRDLEMGVFSK